MTAKASDFWGSFNKTSTASSMRAELVLEAHHMVETFINAFTRENYQVDFADNGHQIAYTLFDKKRIFITASPLYDKSLTLDSMADILSGLACHEISHTRYGKESMALSANVFGLNANAHMLANLLDDIRIERRFSAEYPGFANIFRAPMDYVGQRDCTGQPISNADIAVRATRYDKYTDWSQADPAERQWWIDWADRFWYTTDDVYINGIREALAHLAELKKQEQAAEKARTVRTAGMEMPAMNLLMQTVNHNLVMTPQTLSQAAHRRVMAATVTRSHPALQQTLATTTALTQTTRRKYPLTLVLLLLVRNIQTMTTAIVQHYRFSLTKTAQPTPQKVAQG